jgi:hypothetical protein
MKRLLTVFVLAACLTHAQARRELQGRIVKGDAPSQSAVANANIVLEESGSRDVTNDDGHFRLFVPDLLRPGDEITITVTVAGYAVYEPPGGSFRIPADLARTQQVIELLPKGSPKFL